MNAGRGSTAVAAGEQTDGIRKKTIHLKPSKPSEPSWNKGWLTVSRGSVSSQRCDSPDTQAPQPPSTAGSHRFRRSAQASCRFETGPGEQAQFDWSPYLLQIGGECVQVVIYSLRLGNSRRIHFYPSLCERQDSVLEGLEVGLQHFGGSCRFVVIDNAKTMVLSHRHQKLVWNPCFLAFCGHDRIQPIAATPQHPQTKGKIENPFHPLEAGLLTGGAWRDWTHLGEEIQAYEQAREERIHQTTRQPPAQLFEQERSTLLPLPAHPFLGCLQHVRQLNNDGLFSFGGVRYCVPVKKGEREVRVRTRQGRELLVYDATAQPRAQAGRHLWDARPPRLSRRRAYDGSSAV